MLPSATTKHLVYFSLDYRGEVQELTFDQTEVHKLFYGSFHKVTESIQARTRGGGRNHETNVVSNQMLQSFAGGVSRNMSWKGQSVVKRNMRLLVKQLPHLFYISLLKSKIKL